MNAATVPILNKFLIINPFDDCSEDVKYVVEVNENTRIVINEILYKLLNIIDGKSTISQITKKYNKIISRKHSEQEVAQVIDEVLAAKDIVVPADYDYDKHIGEEKSSYLSYKVPFIKQKWLEYISNIFRFLFKPYVAPFILGLSFFVHYVFYSSVMQPSYIDLDYFLSIKILLLYLVLSVTNTFHEFGHTSALKYFKESPKEIGFAIYLFLPVFYADVSKVWNLKRKQRIVVNLGGIFFELILLNIVMLCYFLTKEVIFLLAFLMIDIKLLFTFLPFLRNDGYWFFSDLWGFSHLKDDSNELAKNVFLKIFRKKSFKSLYNKKFNTTQKILLPTYFFLSYTFYTFLAYRFIMLSYYFSLRLPNDIMNLINNSQNGINFYLIRYLSIRLLFFILALLFVFRTIKKLIKILKSLLIKDTVPQVGI